jgi:hypothetical protein
MESLLLEEVFDFLLNQKLQKPLGSFSMRKQNIRIFGAGYWREGRKLYETKNKI